MTRTLPSHASHPSRTLTIALLVAAGCSNRPRAQADDAGISPGDAAEIDGRLPDALPDAAPEAAPDAAVDAPPPPGIVTVHVFDPFDDIPSIGTRVLFAGPNDELIADTVTDAEGHTSARMAAGYVTVIRPSSVSVIDLNLTTVLGVKQGETIELGAYARDTTHLGTTTPLLPPLPPDRSATVFTPCTSGGQVLTVFADPACREHVGILARAFGVDPALYSYLADQTLSAGGTVQMPAWQPMANTHVVLPDQTNPPRIVLSPFITVISDAGLYSEFPRNGTIDLNFWRPTIGGDVLFRTPLTRADDPFIGKQEVAARAAGADEMSFQLADLTARWLRRPVVDASGPSPVFTWRQEGDDTATVGWISTRYTGSTKRIRWDIVGAFLSHGRPGFETTGTYTLPQLPDPALRLSLSETNVDFARIRILAVNAEVTYDELRPTIARLLEFESAWFAGETGFVDLARMIALPNVRVVRFAGTH